VTDKKTILARIRTVPSLPSVVIKIRQYLKDPDVNFSELARVIEHDPGLTANILQLANSAYFGWTRRIKTVKEAITRLGTNRVFQMVLCMSVAPLVRKPIKGYDLDANQLWEHSFAAAICAEKLVQVLKLRGREEAFTAALLHDMGKVVLGTFVEVDDEPIKQMVMDEGLSFNEAERKVLGIDHGEVAGELLRYWNLPEEVAVGAHWHHEPSRAEEHQEVADLVHAADVVCMRFGWAEGSDLEFYRIDSAALDRLGVTPAVADETVARTEAEFNEMRELYAGSVPQTSKS
jgi:putative nucleotidyltransferase with HDIG domain